MLSSVQIVLVRAENPVNIGQTARVMRNFGARELRLVNSAPHQTQEAYTPGWRGKNILDEAKVFDSLDLAIEDSALVIGFTARSGRRRGEPRRLADIIPQIIETMQNGKVSLVFGNEKNGLSNEELNHCHQIAVILAESDYTSLNLSHAASVALFSIYSQLDVGEKRGLKSERQFASRGEFEELMDDFREVLASLGYNDGARGVLSRTLSHLRRYFKKAGLDMREFHLFKAFLARVRQNINQERPLAAFHNDHKIGHQ